MTESAKSPSGVFLQPMHPGVSLFRTWQFQLSVGLPIFLATIFFFWISRVEQLSFEISSEAVRNLWSYHKLSFTLLGLIFPFTALVASHHRSVQAAEQIRQQQSQNILTNHFSHTEEFGRVWKELQLPEHQHLTMGMREIHHLIFPNSLAGDFSVSSEFEKGLEAIMTQCRLLLVSVEENPDSALLQVEIQNLVLDFSHFTGVLLPVTTSQITGRPFTSVLSSVKEATGALRKIIEAASFLPPHSIRELKKEVINLQVASEKACARPSGREMRLSSIASSLEALIESLGSSSIENSQSLEQIEELFNELVESGDYTDDEIHSWFPWKRGKQRGEYLPKYINRWVIDNAPEGVFNNNSLFN